MEGVKEWEVEKILNKKNKRGREVLSAVERFYGRRRHMGKERKLEKCRGVNREIRLRRSRSEMTGEHREEERSR